MSVISNAALLSVFLTGAADYRRGVLVTANPYRSRQFWNAWSDGWRECQATPRARRSLLVQRFQKRAVVAKAA